MPIIAPPGTTPLTGVLKYEWIDSGGVIRDLTWQTSPNLFVGRGSIGLGAPPVQLTDEKLPFLGGSVVRRVATPPAKMTIPLVCRATSMSGLLTIVDNLHKWFDTGDETELRPGYLRITREDGTVRQRLCYYTGGLEGDLSTGNPQETVIPIDLYAPDGWPTDAADTTYTWVGASSWAAPVGVINAGQLDAYPVWYVQGPGAGITINNLTSTVAWGWSDSLALGEILVVDTRPSSQNNNALSVTVSSANRYDAWVATSKLWHLRPSLNQISIAMTGATGATQVAVNFRQRYRGALR